MEKKISVVIPTHRNLDALLKCLSALNRQNTNYSLFEVIVVSDGLDHELAKSLAIWQCHYQMDLRFLQTASVKGLASARNLGWQNARTDLIAFVDDDQMPDRNWLNSIIIWNSQQNVTADSKNNTISIPKKPADCKFHTNKVSYAKFGTKNYAFTKQELTALGGLDEIFKTAS